MTVGDQSSSQLAPAEARCQFQDAEYVQGPASGRFQVYVAVVLAVFADGLVTSPAVMLNESGCRLFVTSPSISDAAAGSEVKAAAASGLLCCHAEMNAAIC